MVQKRLLLLGPEKKQISEIHGFWPDWISIKIFQDLNLGLIIDI